MEPQTMLRDVLNRERPVTRTYPDGSFDCPFCAAAVLAPAARCENPWCPASTYAIEHPSSALLFQAKLDEEVRRQAETAERAANHTTAMAQIAEDRRAHEAWLDAQYKEARRLGACLRCVVQPGWERSKFIKHRGPCPKGGQP